MRKLRLYHRNYPSILFKFYLLILTRKISGLYNKKSLAILQNSIYFGIVKIQYT